MSITLAELIEQAKDACDKIDDPSVSTDLWRRFLNQAIKALWKKLASQFADNWIATVDFTLASPTNSYALPSTFAQLRHLTIDPTTTARRPMRPFNLQEQDDFRGDPRYRVMGRTIYIEPPENAAGNYRATYVPRPSIFGPIVTVRLATAAVLAGGPWAQTFDPNVIQAVSLGALSIDGVAVVLDDRILVNNEADPTNDGLYTVSDAGSGAARATLTRITGYEFNDTVTVPLIVGATEGDDNAERFFSLDANVIVGTDPFTFSESALDAVLEDYDEYLTEYAAALALEKEQSDSSQQRARVAAIEEDIEVLAGAQEAGAQVAVADVSEDDIGSTRIRRHPLP